MFIMVLVNAVPIPFLNNVVTLMIYHYVSYDISGVRTSIDSVLIVSCLMSKGRLHCPGV
jgi:hypothetical protein